MLLFRGARGDIHFIIHSIHRNLNECRRLAALVCVEHCFSWGGEIQRKIFLAFSFLFFIFVCGAFCWKVFLGDCFCVRCEVENEYGKVYCDLTFILQTYVVTWSLQKEVDSQKRTSSCIRLDGRKEFCIVYTCHDR